MRLMIKMPHGLMAFDQVASLDVGADTYASMHHKHNCINCLMTVVFWSFAAKPSGLHFLADRFSLLQNTALPL